MKHRTNAHLARQKQQSIVYLGFALTSLILMFLSQERWVNVVSALLFGMTSIRGIALFAEVLLDDRGGVADSSVEAVKQDVPLRVDTHKNRLFAVLGNYFH